MFQGTSPWVVSGTVALDAGTLAALETITVNQGTSPWVVSGTVALDAPTLAALETITVLQGTSPWVVSGTVALDAPTLAALETITVNQGTNPWTVDGTVELGAVTLAALETITVNQGTSPWVVSGVMTPADSVISTLNSTSTPLAGGGAFIGTFESTLPFVEGGVMVISDQPSATDGLRIEQSIDGIQFADVDVYTIAANNGKQYTFALNSRFFRVTYTNGPTPQTRFELSTIFRRTGAKPSSHRINDTIITQDDAELVKSVLSGQITGGGSFVNIEAEPTGYLHTHDEADHVEDAVAADGDVGIGALGVRNDTGVAKTSNDGDYTFFATDAAGRMGVADLGGSITIDAFTEYNESDPHTDGDLGTFVLAVRNDAGTPLAADGEYIPFTTDATGALRVNATFTGEVTVALDCATDSVTICPGDDPIIVEIEGVTPVSGSLPVIFDGTISVALDCATDSVTICPGDDPIVVDQGTNPWVTSLDAATLAALETITVNQGTSPWVIGDGGGSITVDGTVTADTNFDYAEDSLHVSGDIGAFVLAVRNDAGTPLAGNGDYIPITTDATGALRVTGSTAGTVFQHQEILCDDNGPFVRKYIQDAAGLVTSVVDFDLEGDPYVVVGTVETCNSGSTSTVFQHQEILCDDDVTFVRKYIQDADGIVTSVVDFDLEGDPYVVTGTVQVCASDVTPVTPQSLDSTIDRLTGVGSIAVLAGAKSVTVIVYGGNPTVTIDADPAVTLVPGMSLTWAVDDRTESLLNAFTFTGTASSDMIVFTTSGPLETDVLDSTINRLTGAGSVIIPAGASSTTITVISGAPTVQIGAGPSITLSAGMSLTWAVDSENEDLLDAFTFTGFASSDFVVTSTRI